jgi:HEAT repeat protein
VNDWVPQVAERALLAVQARLVGPYADTLIDCLPLLAGLERSTRRDHRAVIDGVYAVLRDSAQREALARGRQSPDRLIRRLCFRLARESAGAAILELFRESRDDPDPTVRLAAITDTVARVESHELEDVMDAASTDTFVPVRRVALDAVATRLDTPLALPWLERGLLDDSRSVRDVSRYHLARLHLPVDVTQYYVDVLARTLRARTLATALAGLRETGQSEHVGIALGFLAHDRPVVRRAALRTVAALDATRHLDWLVAMLDDPSPTVANSAAEVLLPHVDAIGIDAILATVRSAPRSHNRVAAASLALRLGKWNTLLALLDTTSDPDTQLRESVDRWLREWLDRQNRAYAQPTPVQLGAIARALAENGARLGARMREEIEHTVAYWSPK